MPRDLLAPVLRDISNDFLGASVIPDDSLSHESALHPWGPAKVDFRTPVSQDLPWCSNNAPGLLFIEQLLPTRGQQNRSKPCQW